MIDVELSASYLLLQHHIARIIISFYRNLTSREERDSGSFWTISEYLRMRTFDLPSTISMRDNQSRRWSRCSDSAKLSITAFPRATVKRGVSPETGVPSHGDQEAAWSMPKRIAAAERTDAGRQDAGAVLFTWITRAPPYPDAAPPTPHSILPLVQPCPTRSDEALSRPCVVSPR